MSFDFLALPGAYELVVIASMVIATYSTRVIGWLLLRDREVSPRLARVLDAAPACVMMAIVAPSFMTTDIRDLATLFLTVGVAYKTKNMPATVIFSVVLNGLLHHFF